MQNIVKLGHRKFACGRICNLGRKQRRAVTVSASDGSCNRQPVSANTIGHHLQTNHSRGALQARIKAKPVIASAVAAKAPAKRARKDRVPILRTRQIITAQKAVIINSRRRCARRRCTIRCERYRRRRRRRISIRIRNRILKGDNARFSRARRIGEGPVIIINKRTRPRQTVRNHSHTRGKINTIRALGIIGKHININRHIFNSLGNTIRNRTRRIIIKGDGQT